MANFRIFCISLLTILMVTINRYIYFWIIILFINPKAVREYIKTHRHKLRVIEDATYEPNLKLIEWFLGHLKHSAIHNYYFETVENLEKAIMKAVEILNRQKNHPLRLHLQTVQNLSNAA